MPPAKYIKRGSSIDWTPGTNVAAGSVVVFTGAGAGRFVGVAERDVAANELGSAQIEGEFEFDALNTDTALTGDRAYWDAANSRVTVTASGNTLMGGFTAPKINGQTRVRIRLDGVVV